MAAYNGVEKRNNFAEDTQRIILELKSLVTRIHELGNQCVVLYFEGSSKKIECHCTGAIKDFFTRDIITKFLSCCYNAQTATKRCMKRSIPSKPTSTISGTKKPRLSAPDKVREKGPDVSTDQRTDAITTTQFSNNIQDTEYLSGNTPICEENSETEGTDSFHNYAIKREKICKSAVKHKEIMPDLGFKKGKKEQRSNVTERSSSKEKLNNIGKTNKTIQLSQKNNMVTENQDEEDINNDDYGDDDLDEDWEANTEPNEIDEAENYKSTQPKNGTEKDGNNMVSMKTEATLLKNSTNVKSSVKKISSVETSVGFPEELGDDNQIDPKCLECRKKFKDLIGLEIHLERSKHELVCNTETDYKCFTCYRYYLRFSDLKRHMENTDHSGNFVDKKGTQERTICKIQSRKLDGKARAQFRCSLCGADFRREKNCQEHIDKATCVKIPPKKCPCCLSVFRKRNFLEVHLKQKHKSEFPFRCNLCSKTFFEGRQFTYHRQEHEQEYNTSEVLENTEGKEGINDIESVEIDQSDAQEALDGPAAPVGSAEKEILDNQRLEEIISKQRRLRGVTDDQAVIQDEVDCEQECVVCHEKFVNYTQMTGHINETGHEQIVTKETGYKCYTCDNYFVKYLDLNHHMEITEHTGNPVGEATRKPLRNTTWKTKTKYKCSNCFIRFYKLEKCEEHIRLNLCKKRFQRKCQCCNLLMWRRNDYHAHLYQYHRYDYPFICDKCDTEFTLLRVFKAHCKTHENYINYDCDKCDKSYLKRYQLKQHKQEVHRKSPVKEKEVNNTNTTSAASQVDKEVSNTNTTSAASQVDEKVIDTNTTSAASQVDKEVIDTKTTNAASQVDEGVLDTEQTNNGIVMTEEAADTQGTNTASGIEQNVIDINGTSTKSDYRCFTCNLYYLNMKSLRDHISLTGHTGNPGFTGDIKLVPILLKQGNKYAMQFRCNKCRSSFPTLKRAQMHVKFAACTTYWKKICPCCRMVFRNRNFYEAHMLESHKNEYPFRCEDCERVFYEASAYSSHRESSHKWKPSSLYPEGLIKEFHCPHCPEKFKGKGNYTEHLKSVHIQRDGFTCHWCRKHFIRHHYLRDHVRNIHTEVSNPDCTCEICGKVLKTPKNKEIHVKLIHLKENDDLCHICGYQAGTLQGLRAHFAQVHSEEDLYRCRLCKSSFKVRFFYDMHMATHYLKLGDVETAKLYSIVHQCDVCNKYFANKTKCQIHLLSHFGEDGLVQCKLCDLKMAAHRGGIINHYMRGHKLTKQQMEPYMADIPSTKQLMENVRKHAKVTNFEKVEEVANNKIVESVPAVANNQVVEFVPLVAKNQVVEFVPAVANNKVVESVPAVAKYQVVEFVPAVANNKVVESVPAVANNKVVESVPAVAKNQVVEFVPAVANNKVVESVPAVANNKVVESVPAVAKNQVVEFVPAVANNKVVESVPAVANCEVVESVPAVANNQMVEFVPAVANNQVVGSVPAVANNKVVESVPAVANNQVVESLPAVTNDEVVESVPAVANNQVVESVPAVANNQVVETVPAVANCELVVSVPAVANNQVVESVPAVANNQVVESVLAESSTSNEINLELSAIQNFLYDSENFEFSLS